MDYESTHTPQGPRPIYGLGISLSRSYRLRLAWPSKFRLHIVLLIRNLQIASLPPHRDSEPTASPPSSASPPQLVSNRH